MASNGEDPKEKYKRQTDEIHAALGRHVEAFERVVGFIRAGCQQFACVCVQGPGTALHSRLVVVIFNHRSMSADTLFSIYRSLVGEIIRSKKPSIEDSERSVVESVLRQFNTDFQMVVNDRNDYLHGTWFIGYENALALPSTPSIALIRGKAKNTGIEFVAGPKSSTEIDEKSEECRRLAEYFLLFHHCFNATQFMGAKGFEVSSQFEQVVRKNAKGEDAKVWAPKRKAT